MEGLSYEYDSELEQLSQGSSQNQPNSNINNQLQYGNSQYGNNQYGNNQYGNNQYGNAQFGNNQRFGQLQQQQQLPQGDSFSRFQAKQNLPKQTFQDLGYNPAHRFKSIKGKRKKK